MAKDISFAEEQSKILEFFRPKSSPRPLMRVGGEGDGAYLVPEDFDGVTDCFSPGVADAKTFEDQLLLDYGIRSHLLDRSAEPSGLSTFFLDGFQTFESKWLGPRTEGDFLALEDWVRMKADPAGDLILQIDIEGAEFEVFQSASVDLLRRFRIIVVELHWIPALLGSEDAVREVLTPMVGKLGDNFVTVHAHANNCCGERVPEGMQVFLPNIFELTLLRKDRYENGLGEILFKPIIPHPLDIKKNMPQNPHLTCELGSKRSRVANLFFSFRYFFEDFFDTRVSQKALLAGLRTPVRLKKWTRRTADYLYKKPQWGIFRLLRIFARERAD